MSNKITVSDILSLHPVLLAIEEVYRIETEEDSVLYLEIYANSDFGCEYTLFNEDYDDIDGGVLDDTYSEDEEEVAQIIFDLLEELNVQGISISKLSREEDDEDNVDSFLEMVEERWEEKKEVLLRALSSV